jgi:hypothetical protein
MRKVFTILLLVAIQAISYSQVTTNEGSGLAPTYTSLSAAIAALNAATITSPVVITLEPGNPETAPAGGYSITASGTSSNTIVIFGNNNVITAPSPQVSGILHDAIFEIVGGDWITIDGFTMLENPLNTATTAGSNNMTEWGVALLYASTTNGAQNNTIQNNTITLNRTYQNTWGIYSNSTHSATTMTTSATATTAAGGNSGLKIYGNIISNVNQGICVVGPTAAADHNAGLDIGGSGGSQGNSITNWGTTGTFSGYVNVSGTINGILVRNTVNYNISYNTLTSSVGGNTVTASERAIYVPSFTNAPIGTISNTINNNSISVRSGLITGTMNGIIVETTTSNATSSLTINNNDFNNFGHTVAGTGAITFINSSMAYLNTTITNNTFTNINCNTTGSVTFISNSITVPGGGSQTINNNSIVTAFNKTGAGGTVTGITSGGSSTTVTSNWNNNNFSNITVTGTTAITIINNTDGGSVNHNVIGNIISNIIGGSSAITAINSSFGGANGGNGNLVSGNTISNITSSGAITGISIGSSGTTSTVSGNAISGLSSTGIASVIGITSAAPTSGFILKNKICDLQANNASGTVSGIVISAGTVHTVVNNVIGDLRTPSANAANPLVGINITGGTTANVYYNTVYLNGTSSGALFGSSAISASTSPALTLRNNIFVNTSVPNGATGYTAAYRRSFTTLTTYNAASDNNLFYAGIPSTNRLIMYDGTNAYQTLAAYKTAVSTRDAASISENPSWISTTGADATFLHIDAATATGIESGGASITGFSSDFDGDFRFGDPSYAGTGTAPDMGADEFEGVPLPLCTGTPDVSTINGVASLCSGTGTSLTLSTTYTDLGITFQWKASETPGGPYDILLGTSPTQATGNLTNTTYYICEITCTNSSEVFTTPEKEIIVKQVPSATASSSAPVCAGGDLELTGTTDIGTSFSWTGPNSFASADQNPVIVGVTTAATGSYTFTATTDGCSSAPSTISVTVNAIPTGVTASASSNAVCDGVPFDLFANYSSNPSLINPDGNGGFEIAADFTGNGWITVNAASNFWILGSQATGYSGARSAYISETGSSYNYSTSTSRTSHFYRDIEIPIGATNISLQFSWRGNGESGWDRLLVYTAPTTITPVVNVPASNSSTLSGATLVFTQPVFTQTTFTTATVSLPDGLAGTNVRLIFTWQNDGSGGTSPGAAVDNISLTAMLPALTYSWVSDPAGFTSTDQNPVGVVQSSTIEYTVTAQNSAGCTATASTTVTNVSGADITGQPVAVEQCAGTTATFTVTATGPSLTYQWRKDGIDIPVAENATAGTATLSLMNISAADEAEYDVVVQAVCGLPATSNAASLTVNELPVVEVTPVTGLYCLPTGTPVTLTASGAETYAWSPASGLNTTTGNEVIATPSVSTTYTVTGTSLNGCYGTATAAVQVSVTPGDVTAAATPADICTGSFTQLTSSAYAPQPSTVNNYVFSTGTDSSLDPMTGAVNVINSSNDDTPMASAASIGFVFNYNGVDYSQFSASPDGWLMLGAGAAGSQYSNSVTSITNVPKIYAYWDDLATGTDGYVRTLVNGTAPNRIFIAEWFVTIPRNTSGAANSRFQVWLYESSNKIEFRYGAMGPQTSGSASSGLTGSPSSLYNSITFTSNTASTSAANDGNSGVPASGRIYTFKPASSVLSYSWEPSALVVNSSAQNTDSQVLTTPTEFTVTADNAGCTASAQVLVGIIEGASVTEDPTAVSVCAGLPASFSVEANGPSLTYQWRKDGVNIDALENPSAATATLTLPSTTLADQGNYDVAVQASCGSPVYSATASLTVSPAPSALASSNSPVCEGQTIQLTGTTDFGTSFNWTGPNGFTSNDQNPSIANATTNADGTYTLITSFNECSSAPAVVDVVVNPFPSAITITPSAPDLCTGESTQLTASGGILTNFMLNEDFNNILTDWTVINNSTGGDVAAAAWTQYLSGIDFHSNDNSIFILSDSDAQGSGGTTATELISPSFSTVGFPAATLSFWHYYYHYSGSTARVEISTDGGSSWNPTALATYTSTQGSATSWVNVNIDLSAYLNQPSLKIRFRFNASWGYYWGVDNVTVSNTEPLPLTWSPVEGLFTDAECITAYMGEALSVVYAKPDVGSVYTVTAVSPTGCNATGQVQVTVNEIVTPTFEAVAPVCNGGLIAPLPSTSTNGITGTWSPALDNTATTTYTFTPDAGQCATTATLTIVVNAVPEVTDVTLLADVGAAPSTWLVPVGGDFSNGFNICIDPLLATGSYYFLDINTLTASTPLKINTLNGFTIDVSELPANWFAYWADKGVTAGAGSGTWQEVMWPIINGNAPILYINYDGSDYQLIDGLVYQYASAMVPLRISGDYPEWNYSFNGRVESIDGCLSSFFEVSLFIDSQETPTFAPVAAICAGESLSPLPTTSLNGISGTWSPALNNLATTTYTFAPNAGLCASATTLTITVNPLPVVNAGAYGPVCEDAADITLLGAPAGGVWSGTGVNGDQFDPSAGTQTLTYTVVDGNSCSNSAQTLVTVYPLPVVDPGSYGPSCSDGADIVLSGSPAGGVWSGAGVSGTGPYVFDPSTGTQTLTYTFTDGNFCMNSATTTILVSLVQPVDPGTYGPVCIDAADVLLNGTPAGGIWTGSGVVGTGPYYFDASFGTQTLTYTWSDGVFCSNSATTEITVNNLPTVIAGSYGPVCADAIEIFLDGMPAGGVWSGTGVAGNLFDPSFGTQTLTYTYTDANLCVNSDVTTITVNPLPVVDAGSYGPVCIDAADITLLGSPAGGEWSGTGVTGNLFDPSVGTQTLTYTYTDANLCTNTATTLITVNSLLTPTFDPVAPICAGETLSPLPATSLNGITGSWVPALDNLVTATYTFTPDAGQCAAVTTLTIQVNPLPVVDAGTYGPVCIDAADVVLAGTPVGGIWSGNGVSGSLFDPSAGTQTLTYTYTDLSLCSNSATTVITVNSLVTPTFDPVDAICEGEILNPLPATSLNGITGSWAPALNNMATTQYTFTPDAGQCATETTLTITVNPLPSVNAGIYGPVCETDTDITLSGTPAGGVWTGIGVTGNQFDPSFGTQTLTYTYQDANLCSNSATTVITVVLPVTPTFDPVAAICAGESLNPLPASSLNGITGSWTPALNNMATTVYTFSPDAGQCAETTTLEITVNPLPVVIAGSYGPYDINDPDVLLEGMPAGGIWSGTGVTGSGPYYFDPSFGTRTLTYTYSDGNSCTNSDITTIVVTEAPPVLVVTPADQQVSNTAGIATFNVVSNKVWSATCDQSWCTVTPAGSGDGSIIATFTANSLTTSRVANISVSVFGLPPVVVTVTQAASPFLLSARNVKQTAPNKLEFDVYLLDVDDTTPFEMASMQLGFMMNNGIYTGGSLTVTYNNSGSGLLTSQQFSAPVSFVQNPAGYPGQTLIRLAGKTPPGTGNGTIISTSGDGTLITHFILTSSVPFADNSQANLTFTANTATTPLYGTKVAQYISGINTQLPVTPGNNAIFTGNPVLNGPPQLAVTPPSQNVGVLAGAVDYTVFSNATWNAISDQPWCIVTTTGFGDGTITATYDENTGAQRTAVITVSVAGLPDVQVTLIQNGKELHLHALLEGLYIGGGNMSEAKNALGNPQFPGFADQITVELHNAADYSIIEYSATALLNTTGTAILTNLPQSLTDSYYITIRHRNSIETTTAMPVSFAGNLIDHYMLTPADVYGGNLQLFIDGAYAIYTGDVNQDGVVDTADMTDVDNDSEYYNFGYLPTDIDGNGTCDTQDMTIVDNNSKNYISILIP